MKNNRFFAISLLVKSIVFILLGIAHTVATFFFENENIKIRVSEDVVPEYMLWFFAAGLLVGFIGIIDFLCYKAMKNHNESIFPILTTSTVFTLLMGLSCTIIYKDGVPILILIFGVYMLVVQITAKINKQ